MTTLLIVTDIDFWRGGAGHRARLSSLIQFLQMKVNTTVVYAGTFSEIDRKIVASSFPQTVIDVLEHNQKLSYREFGQKFEAYIADRTFDAVLVEYIELFTILPYLKPGTLTLLDPHDLVADRIRSFAESNVAYYGVELTEEEEFRIFSWFHYVLAIQKQDYEKISSRLGAEHVLLVPHAISFPRIKPKDTVQNIGFVASEYVPNVRAIISFVEQAWPSLVSQFNLTLNIYGNVYLGLPEKIRKTANVKIHGFIPDLNAVYEECDVIINPVTTGAGLKIKNIEALASGLPLVTTTHGATGIEDGAGTAFLVADGKDAFVEKIAKLTTDLKYRLDVCENAWTYAKRFFSPEQCYTELIDILTGRKSSP